MHRTGSQNKETLRWIERHAVPLGTLDPEAPTADLRPLDDQLREAKVVALGGSTRESHELLLLAHRMFRYLVTEHGFRSLLLEGDEVSSAVLDGYLRTGTGDPEAVLAAGRPFYRTREILHLLHWMRSFNEQHPDDQLRLIHPLDPQPPDPSDLAETERRLAASVLDWHARTGHRIVHWGGIAHTANGEQRSVAPGQTHRNAGALLRGQFGTGFVSVGLLFDHGTLSVPVPSPPADFAETPLRDHVDGVYLLDLRDPAGPAWLTEPARTRLVGPNYDPANDAEQHLAGGSLAELFDLLGYVREVSGLHFLGVRPIR